MATIKISGNARHVSAVEGVLKKIKEYQVGQILLKDMDVTKKTLDIQPYDHNDDPVHGPCNAVTSAVSPEDSAPDGIGKANLWYAGQPDNPLTRDKDERETLNPPGRTGGTGKGSHVIMKFSPDVIAEKNCFQGQGGSLPDEMFLHELVHALRMMQGQRNPIPTQNRDYMNEEEFIAIVTANVYISEKGSDQLRRDYDGHWQLHAPLNTSAGFLSDKSNHHLMNVYHLIWRPTFRNLATVITAKFNPFRHLVEELAWLYSPGKTR